MLPKIIFHSTFPGALKKETKATLEPLLPLVGDLETVQVILRGAGDEHVPSGEAAILVKRQYHVAHIWLDPIFFSLPEEERRQTLLHELIHVRLDALGNEIQHLLKHWVPDGVDAYVYDRINEVEEETTDALAHAIERLLTHMAKGR